MVYEFNALEYLKIDSALQSVSSCVKLTVDEQDTIVKFAIADAVSNGDDIVKNAAVIHRESPVGVALQETGKTAYFSEAQFKSQKPDDPHRYMATIGIANCICVFVHSVDGTSFGTHLNLVSMYYSLEAIKYVNPNGTVFQNMSDELKSLFKYVDPSDITVSLVGGWRKADFGTKLKETFYRSQKSMWTFSNVVVKCIEDALPGVKIDKSKLNCFDGVSWENRTPQTKLNSAIRGQMYRVAVMDTHTGKVYVQTTDISDLTGENTVGACVPPSVTLASLQHLVAMHARIANFKKMLRAGEVPESVLQNCTGQVFTDHTSANCVDQIDETCTNERVNSIE
jgi:hypothetical protein